MSLSRLRVACAVTLAAVAALALPGLADAATVAVADGVLTYTDDIGEVNDVSFTQPVAGTITLTDDAAVVTDDPLPASVAAPLASASPARA